MGLFFYGLARACLWLRGLSAASPVGQEGGFGRLAGQGRAQGGTKNEAHFKAALRFLLNCRARVLRRGRG